ncbi:MAG: hypothetical protein ACXIU8_13480 [Alkalilacustris sp.]
MSAAPGLSPTFAGLAAAAFVGLPCLGVWAAAAAAGGWAPPGAGVWAAGLGAYVLAQARVLRRGSWILLVVFGAAVAVGWAGAPDAPAVALQGAGPIAALLAGLSLLGRAAGDSPDVTAAARYLAARPPRRRYAALCLGTHLLGVLLNFGAVLVMATLLAQGRDRLAPAMRRAATLAVLRGFAAMPFWSPLALSVVVTISILPAVGYGQLWPWGMGFAALYMAAGFALEARAGCKGAGVERSVPLDPDGPEGDTPGGAARALLRVGLRTAVLLAASVGLLAAGLPIVAAVLVASLMLALPWLWVQRGPAAWRPAALASAGRSMANETVVVSGAALAGAALVVGLAPMVPAAGTLGPVQAAAVGALVPMAMAAGGAVALNPIVTASLALGLLQVVWPPEALHWLGLAVIFGWGITAAGTPFTATILIAARILDRPPLVLAYRDNAALTLAALAVGGALVAAGVILSTP